MILDSIENFQTYTHLHPSFEEVFEYLSNTDFSEITQTRITFEGKPFFINVDESILRSEDEAFLETHDAYIDIQMPLTCPEIIGYSPRNQCQKIKEAFPDRDITFYADKPVQLFTLYPGNFAVFFPQDAHAPIIGEGKIKKIVAKIKINC